MHYCVVGSGILAVVIYSVISCTYSLGHIMYTHIRDVFRSRCTVSIECVQLSMYNVLPQAYFYLSPAVWCKTTPLAAVH